MKSIMTLAAGIFAAALIAGAEPDRDVVATGTRDTYKFSMSLEVPHLKNGVRNYTT